MITQFTTIMIAGLILYQLVYSYVDKNKALRIKTIYLLSLVCFIPGFLIPFYYTHLLDDQVWYYEFRSINYVEYVLILLAPLFAIISVHFKRVRVLFLLGFVSFATLPYMKHLGSPLNTLLLKNEINDGITMQISSGTCGPSAVASLLRGRGIEVSEKEVAEHCHTTQSGTEIWHIKRYLKTVGIESEFVIDKTVAPPYPAIAGINVLNLFGHFISILDFENGKYTIGDSMYGKKVLPVNGVKRHIDFTGFYLKLVN